MHLLLTIPLRQTANWAVVGSGPGREEGSGVQASIRGEISQALPYAPPDTVHPGSDRWSRSGAPRPHVLVMQL
ncbi:unnamed protein product [Boreogadus saida]